MAVVCAAMRETGFNKTELGKGILGACFVTDLDTVPTPGLMFAPFTRTTAVLAANCAGALVPALVAPPLAFVPHHLLTPEVEAELATEAAAVALRRQTDEAELLEEG